MKSKEEKLTNYLERALNIIISLEESFQEIIPKETLKDIEALFQEIKYSDHIDADMEAQDFDTFGTDKI